MSALREYYDAQDALDSCRERSKKLTLRNEELEAVLRHVLRYGKLGKQSRRRLREAAGL